VRATCNLAVIALLAVGAVLAVGAGCGGDSGGSTAITAPADADIVLVAKNVKFDSKRITLTAGAPTTIAILNLDEGVNHNVHLYDAPGSQRTNLEQGPVVQVLDVTIDKPGTYHFICDLHANMKGTVLVEPGG
jgi:plastocyanin